LQSVTGQQGVTSYDVTSYNIAGLISEVSEEVATQIARNCRRQQPHSHLRSPRRGTPRVSAYRPNLYFQKLESLAYIFVVIQICAVGSKRRIFSASECVLDVQGCSGSSMVDDFGTNRKHVYDFPLVGHCDYSPILHRFRDMVTYWLKVAYFCYIFATPVSFGALDPYLPLGISRRS